jgi:chlorite dismutase
VGHGGAPSRGARVDPGTDRGGGEGRVCVAFTFFRLRQSVFALPPVERRRLAGTFEDAVNAAADNLGILRSYSLVGLRSDADILLWQASGRPEGLQQFAAGLRRAELYAHLEVPYQYLAITRRSIYVDRHMHLGQDGLRTRPQPTGAPYLFVYPFVKTRAWYALPREERQRMMDEHIATGHRYPRVKINTTYSFGIDDQEFVVAFEAESPAEFLDLVMELRSSAASAYTLRDTPAFTAVSQPLGRALEIALGLAEAEPGPLEVSALEEALVSGGSSR